MVYLPIFGAIALASGTILEKVILRKRKVGIGLYNSAGFLAIILVMLPFIYFFWDIRPEAFIPRNIFLFFLVIIFSIIANILIFYSTKWEKLNNIEPAKLLEPILVILLAVLLSFFAEEMYDRNIKIIIPAIIAG